MHGWQSNDIYCAVQGKLSLLRLLKRQEVLIKQDQQGAFLLMHGADGNIQCLINEHSQEYYMQAKRSCITRTCREDASKAFNPKEGAEKFTFQAEVNRLMDIIIHSLYSNKVGRPMQIICHTP